MQERQAHLDRMKKSEAANNLENHKPIHQRTENLLRIREEKIREKKAD